MKILIIGCGLQGFEIARDLNKDKNITLGKDKDFTLMRVEITGNRTIRYEVVDYYARGVTSMARTTGYPCAIVARLIDKINRVGIITPEELGKNNLLFSEIIEQLRNRGVKIRIHCRGQEKYALNYSSQCYNRPNRQAKIISNTNETRRI
jgi:saccharopine dehydrogenase-like NADP-dependent oxidoreductase